jgi:O-antigen/teichoic acid export membrane protein
MTIDSPVSAEAIAESQQVRKRRLTYALVMGVISKTLAVAVQWLALPLALKALGTDRYAAFLALQALVAWASLLALGLAPSLPRFISNAYIAGQRELQRDIFQTTILYLATVCLAFAIVMLALGYAVPPSEMVATHGVAADQIFTAYQAVILITCLQLLGNVMPSIRGGYQELHYSFAWAGLASLLVLGGLRYIADGKPSIVVFLTTIYAPLAMLMLADMALICVQRPYLLRGRANLVQTRRMLAPQASNALAAQFAYFLVSFLPTLILAHLSGATATAAFGSIMQLLILAGSGMNLIYQPLVPAIANAYAHHDGAWVRQAYFRAAKLVGLICGAGFLTNIFLGKYLLHRWLGASLAITSPLPIVLGIYFTMWMVNVMHFNILAATGNLNRIGKTYLVEGALSISVGSLLAHFFGATGMAAGLAVGTACVNFWFLTLQVWRHVLRPAQS